MREITFRGMAINGKWYYGNLAVITERVGIAPIGSYISNSIGSPLAFYVRPETVGQYTGLRDKNGKKIYEGDIIKTDESSSPQVIQYDFHGDHSSYMYQLGWNLWEEPIYEVIGNIYENPDLLKK